MQVNRLRWQAGKLIGGNATAGEEAPVGYKLRAGARWRKQDGDAFVVELQPMEIRTFLLTADPAQAQPPQGSGGVAAATLAAGRRLSPVAS